MKSNFERWNILKQDIHLNRKNNFYVKQREVWYVNVGVNIGTEENGKHDDYRRPVLVLKKIGSLYLCLPMTSKGKDNNYFYYKYQEDSYMILSQVKTFDKKRFLDKAGVVDKENFTKITKRLKTMWF